MPYRSYKGYARRMKSQGPLQDEGRARFVDLQYPSISAERDRPQSNPWKPSPDDVTRVRDAYKWGQRFYEMGKTGLGALRDNMIPLLGDAYSQLVKGYEAVHEAYDLWNRGYESYRSYKQKLDAFRKQFPGAPAPSDVASGRPVADRPIVDRGEVGDVDVGYGPRTARGPKPYVPYVPSGTGVPRVPRGSGDRSGEQRARRSGGGSKLAFKKTRYVFS